MPSALVGLGSNVGDRQATLDRALELLSATDHVTVAQTSRWIVTKPIGHAAGTVEFLNGAALLDTTLQPDPLFARLQEIENQLGRTRTRRWEPRTIDLDLLLYDELVQRGARLELPHPRMAYRRFVLAPAAEIGGTMMHPGIGWSIDELLAHLDSAYPYVAIRGSQTAAKRNLAAAVGTKIGWKVLDFPESEQLFAPASSTSLTLTRAIEFLRRAADELARVRLPSDDGVISSFWIEEILAAARTRWSGEFEERWNAIAPVMETPKLLVDFESPPVRAERFGGRGICPVLRVESSDQVMAETELLAAIEAMK